MQDLDPKSINPKALLTVAECDAALAATIAAIRSIKAQLDGPTPSATSGWKARAVAAKKHLAATHDAITARRRAIVKEQRQAEHEARQRAFVAEKRTVERWFMQVAGETLSADVFGGIMQEALRRAEVERG